MPSPLKAKPLRNPGQSLDEKLVDLAFDALLFLIIASMFGWFAVMEWIRLWTNSPPNPLLWTFFSIVAVIVAVWKIRPMLATMKNIKQGRDGEKAVGQFLDVLRKDGAKIYHDICSDNFNVDHIVICPTGIFVIETKTWSKLDNGKNLIEFDGSTFKKNNFVIDPSPTVQATACAKYIQELLLQTTGRSFVIQAVVTFPGWKTDHTASFNHLIPWVLNPKALVKFISKAKTELSPEDVNLASYHLSRHIRAVESE